MAAGAAEMMVRCVFDGSISMHDIEIERRLYHRNCGCALHSLKAVCSNGCSPQRSYISFPKKQALFRCSLSLDTSSSKFSSQSSNILNFVNDDETD